MTQQDDHVYIGHMIDTANTEEATATAWINEQLAALEVKLT